jgi:hypothetical protein
MIEKIVSGGQSGADRGALDWAIENHISHGGWCPAGRRAEDGEIAARYLLTETPLADYEQRTKWNVRDSDGTLIISLAGVLTGGSKATFDYAARLGRPCLHLHPGNASGAAVREFIERHRIKVLNIAGPRQSREPRIAAYVAELLTMAELVSHAAAKNGRPNE